MTLFKHRISFVVGYRGHNSGIFNRGPNWLQITIPPSRKMWRCALIMTRVCGEA